MISDTSTGTPPVASKALRLYISRSTPNSVRAEQNLMEVLAEAGWSNNDFSLDIVDVFTNARRAITEGVIVTPTLIVAQGIQRFTIIGDLSDRSHLSSVLASAAPD